MKRKMRINRILARYMPRPPRDEIEAAGQAVLGSLRAELEKHDTSLRSLHGDGWNAPAVDQSELQILTVLSLLGGQARIMSIAETAPGAFGRAMVVGTLVNLQNRGLVTTREHASAQSPSGVRLLYELTEEGERALARAKAEGKKLPIASEGRLKGGCTERPS